MKLDNRVAVITGSARGIGKQIALSFANEGAAIVICDSNKTEMEDTLQQVHQLGYKATAIQADVSKKEQVRKLVQTTLDHFARIDILVNNAGISRPASLLDMPEKDWDDVLNVDLKSVFLCTQAVARYMVAQRYGKIINIASVGGIGSNQPEMANYQAAKAGVIQFTKSCARELSPYGINVNAVAPGIIETTLLSQGKTPEEVQDFIEKGRKFNLLGRVGTPQDIANLVLFLACDDSSYITGQVVVSDGGRADRL